MYVEKFENYQQKKTHTHNISHADQSSSSTTHVLGSFFNLKRFSKCRLLYKEGMNREKKEFLILWN